LVGLGLRSGVEPLAPDWTLPNRRKEKSKLTTCSLLAMRTPSVPIPHMLWVWV